MAKHRFIGKTLEKLLRQTIVTETFDGLSASINFFLKLTLLLSSFEFDFCCFKLKYIDFNQFGGQFLTEVIWLKGVT